MDSEEGLSCETSHLPFFVRRACRSPSGASRCTLRAASSMTSSRRAQPSCGTVSVLGPSTIFTAGPSFSLTGVAATPSTTSLRHPSPSARLRSCSTDQVCQRDHFQLRRRPADERRDREQVVGRSGLERALGPRDAARPPAPSPCVPTNGRTSTTCPLETQKPCRAFLLAVNDHAHGHSAVAASADLARDVLERLDAFRRRAASSNEGRARRFSLARSLAVRRRGSPTRRSAGRGRRVARGAGS